MKKSIFTLIVLSLFFSGNIFAQYVTAYDDAGNYASWSDADNLGFGFGEWILWTENSGGHFPGSSAGQGFGDIDVDGKSFGMWGNPFGTNYSHAKRAFSIWSDGAVFSAKIAIAFRNGNKGIDLIATGDESVFNFNASADAYRAQGSDLGWDYDQASVFTLTATQNGSDVDISITRGTDTYSTTLTGKTLESLKFYCGSTDVGNDLNNLYFNSLKVSYADPAKIPSTANVQIDGDVTLEATQTLTVNNLSIPSGNSFTLESTSEGTGSLIINGTCTDEINVQRFLTADEFGTWHFLSSPVIDQSIVGEYNFIEFPDNIGDENVDFYKFDETEADNPWINIKGVGGIINGDFETTFEEGRGYLVAYKVDDVIKAFTGVPNSGTFNISVSYTGDGQKGWNLIGNPYPSAIDWDKMTKSGLVSDYYYIYNPEMNGGGSGYEYYSSGASTSGANGEIPPMQAFMVWAADGGGQVDFANTDKVHSTQDFLKGETFTDNRLMMKITGPNYFSESQVFISEGASPGQDRMDAAMLFSFNNLVPHFYSIDGNEKIAANAVPFPDEDYSIPMGLKTGESGTYTITAIEIENFNSSVLPVLEDTETGMEIDLRFSESYTFQVNAPGINNSRFVLHLKTSVGINEEDASQKPAVSITSNQMQVYNLKSGEYEVRVLDIMGKVLLNESFSAGSTITLPQAIKAGAYIVQISGERGQWVEKVIIK